MFRHAKKRYTKVNSETPKPNRMRALSLKPKYDMRSHRYRSQVLTVPIITLILKKPVASKIHVKPSHMLESQPVPMILRAFQLGSDSI